MKGNQEEQPQKLTRLMVKLKRTIKREGRKDEQQERTAFVLTWGEIRNGSIINIGHTKNWEVTEVTTPQEQHIQIGDYTI